MYAEQRQEIAADGLDVDERVRRIVHGVDEHSRAHGVGEPCSPRDVGDGAERIRRRADGEQLGARPDRRLEIGPVQPTVVRPHLHHAHGDAAILLQRLPRRDVAVMIELGHHDLVALPSTRGPARARDGR